MPPTLVFGYGSLVDGAAGARRRLAGRRRVWGVAMDNRRTIPGYKYYLAPDGSRPDVCVAFLDVVADPGAAVDGLAFRVDAGRLAALDDRERNYRRVEADLEGAAGPEGTGASAWAYVGLEAARSRYARAAAAGAAVVSREYLEGVRAGFAAYGLAFDTPVDLPVMDLERIDVPAEGVGGRS